MLHTILRFLKNLPKIIILPYESQSNTAYGSSSGAELHPPTVPYERVFTSRRFPATTAEKRAAVIKRMLKNLVITKRFQFTSRTMHSVRKLRVNFINVTVLVGLSRNLCSFEIFRWRFKIRRSRFTSSAKMIRQTTMIQHSSYIWPVFFKLR